MEKKEEYKSIREHLIKQIPSIEKFMDDVKSKIAPSLIKLMQEKSENELLFMKRILNFKLQLVIDNNILFAEIKGLIKGDKDIESCFFYQLALHPSIEFFAPPFLKEEIFRKISEKFDPKEKSKAFKFAKKLLHRIKLKDSPWSEDWIKAKRKIGHRDLDDIPYLALCFDLNGHGIMSNDKIFSEEQKDVKTWSINDTGKITAEFNEGMASFFFLGQIPNLVQGTYSFLSSFFGAVFEAISDLVKIVFSILKGGVSALSKIPVEILLILGIPALVALIINEDAQQKVAELFISLKNKLFSFIENIKLWLSKLFEFSMKLYEVTKPFLKDAGIALSYLAVNSMLVMEEIESLEFQKE